MNSYFIDLTPQARTSSSTSTEAPSGRAATPIVAERFARRVEQGREVAEQLPRLGLDPALDELAGRRVLADLAAEEDEIARADRWRERTDRR
jgi:hypothetical protein